MKINHKMLNLPPYISTPWKNISALLVEDRGFGLILIVQLHNGTRIDIPGLDKTLIQTIFEAHSQFMEEEMASRPTPLTPSIKEDFLPFRFSIGSGIEALGSAMQHNPEQKNLPDLPPEVLAKITGVAKVLGIDDPYTLPKAEPHCNCAHCQIAKALHGQSRPVEQSAAEEVIKDEDLSFRTWDIKQPGEKLYVVSNPLDAKEQYNVYLGDPIGCTCGQKNCEHIRAVLNS